ncbi:MAG: hypothetical protein IT372_23040, partial [Polyangiaceae bacterium]|nr:hypothetical protein [Polyangiaceae bacterium]
MSSTRPAALLVAALALAVSGCSDDTTSTAVAGPTGNPKLAILSPKDGACVAIGSGIDATIPVEIKVENLYLRPPGACGVYKQCGHLVLRVNGVENNRGSATVIDVLLRKLADRYAGLTISVEVINDAGEPILAVLTDGAEPAPLMRSVTVTTQVACEGGGGGSGGSGGSGSGGSRGAAGGGGSAGR